MNNYPILAAQNTWWAPNDTTITRPIITEIEIMDSYTPDSSVTVVDSWDASEAKDGSITCYVVGTKLIMAGNGSGKIAMNEDSSFLFSDPNFTEYFSAVVELKNLAALACNNVSTLQQAFRYMSSITSLDLSSWNTENLTNVSALVFSCTKLASINVTNWETTKITDISVIFRSASSLSEAIGFESWSLPNLEECWGAFSSTLFTSLDLTKWNVSKVTNFSWIFTQMTQLLTIDVSNWDTKQASDMSWMFAHNYSLENIDVSNWDVSNVTNMEYMFGGCQKLKQLDVSNWDMSNVEDTRGMFTECQKLEKLDAWEDFSKVTNTNVMFQNCTALKTLDVTNWNMTACTDMSFMFYGCSSLKEIDVSNWDVSNVTNFDHFAAHANLKRKGIEKWNTSSATNMNAMFHSCAEEELDLSGFNTSKVQFFCQMFENSPNLKRIKGLENWDTSAGLGFDGMFERCYKLEEVDLSSFDTSKAKNGVEGSTNGHKTATLQNMFLSCNNLKKVTIGPNFSINGDGTNTAAANKLILPTPSTDYIESADGMWYTFNGDSYAPNVIPDRTYNTYYASENLIRDLSVRVNNGTILDIVEAVRERVPDLAPTLLSDIDDVIRNIEHKEE